MLFVACCWADGDRCLLTVVRRWLLVVRGLTFVACRWSIVVCCSFGCLLFVDCCLVVCCVLLVECCLFVVRCVLFVVCFCPLCVNCCSLLLLAGCCLVGSIACCVLCVVRCLLCVIRWLLFVAVCCCLLPLRICSSVVVGRCLSFDGCILGCGLSSSADYYFLVCVVCLFAVCSLLCLLFVVCCLAVNVV